MSHRPGLITLLAIFGALRGGMGLLACGAMAFSQTPPKTGYIIGQMPDAMIFGAGCVFTLVLSWGLYNGQKWTWWFHTVPLANIFALFITIIVCLQLGWFVEGSELRKRMLAHTTVFGTMLVVPLLLLLYFMKRNVVDFFELPKSRGFYVGVLLMTSIPAITLGLWASHTSFAQWRIVSSHRPNFQKNDTILCSKETPAFDPKNASKQIGAFTKNTVLTIADPNAASGLVLVEYLQPNGKTIQALCKPEDLRRER